MNIVPPGMGQKRREVSVMMRPKAVMFGVATVLCIPFSVGAGYFGITATGIVIWALHFMAAMMTFLFYRYERPRMTKVPEIGMEPPVIH